MLKSASERIAEAVARLWEETGSLIRGDLILWEDIEAAAGASRSESSCRTVVVKLKRRYERERGITLWSVPTVGYRLCTTAEQLIECSEARTKRAGRQLRRGINHMAAIPDHELTLHQRSLRTGRVSSHKRALRQVRAARNRDAALLKPTSSGIPLR